MRILGTLRSRLVVVIAVSVTTMAGLQAWGEYRGNMSLLLAQARKTVAMQYYPVKRLVEERAGPHGVDVTSEQLMPVRKEFGFHVSIVVPDGQGFRYLAKTHDLTIPEKMFPWLRKAMQSPEPLFRRVSKNGKELVTYYTRMTDASGRVAGVVAIPRDITADMAELRRDALLRLGIGVGLLALVLLVIHLVLGRCVNRPLKEFLRFLDAASEDGYSGRLPDDYAVEMAALARGVNGLMDTVQEAMGQAREGREQALGQARSAQEALDEVRREQERVSRMVAMMAEVAGKAGRISVELTESGERMAAQAGETARDVEAQREFAVATSRSMEEMNGAVLLVARNAAEASRGAGAARDKAREGAGVVESVSRAAEEAQEHTDGMKEALELLGRRAEDIGRIIGVITDIADQTNLLALNAAIEAARAGDAGRGFAVVADEVRKLAEKTMAATREVEESVSGIQAVARDNVRGMDVVAEAVRRSNDLSTDAGGYLNEIVGIVTEAAASVEAIAAAAEEQSAASEHISASMEEMAEVSERTARGMGRSSEAIGQVAELAADLRRLITELERCADCEGESR